MSEVDLLNWKLDRAKPENYYRMPPVGITETRCRIGKEIRHMYTVRCGHEECWFVGHAGNKSDCIIILDEHKCPTPPHRNELPAGRSTLEKMWDELDAVTDALFGGASYNGQAGEQLKGYARGLAFTLSMMTHPYFRTADDIVREAVERRKMRNGEVPFRDTPSYKYNPMAPATVAVVKTEPAKKSTATARKVAGRRMLTPQLSTTLTVDKITQDNIRTGVESGLFTIEQVAEIYNVTVATVKQVVG